MYIQSKKQRLSFSLISALFWYLLANGYRFFSSNFSGDSLILIHQNDSAWEIALGRYLQPFVVLFRGGLANPYLISILTILWLGLSLYFLSDFLELGHKLSTFACGAIMACNSTIVAMNTAFILYMDVYALALLTAVLGVWFLKKGKLLPIILGTLSLTVSMGIYQSYICVAIGLVMIHVLMQMFKRPDFKQAALDVVKYCAAIVASALLYYALWAVVRELFGIWAADTYNGMASVGDFSESSFLSVLATTYAKVFHFFFYPDVFVTIPFRGTSLSILWLYLLRLCNAAVLFLILFVGIRTTLREKTSWWQKLAQLFVLLLFPAGVNFVCILTKGMAHALMIYGFYLVYILAVVLVEKFAPPVEASAKKSLLYLGVCALLAVITWSNLVYSNQVYLKKDLQEKATHSMMTRIVASIEDTEGYDAGVTPVAILGSFAHTDYVPELSFMKELQPYGMGNSAITYIGTEQAYLKYVLNTNMNLVQIGDEDPTLAQMPCYPAKGSVAFIGEVLVVKISDLP